MVYYGKKRIEFCILDIEMENGTCKHLLMKGECWLCAGNKPTKEFLQKDLIDLGGPPDFDRVNIKGHSRYAVLSRGKKNERSL